MIGCYCYLIAVYRSRFLSFSFIAVKIPYSYKTLIERLDGLFFSPSCRQVVRTPLSLPGVSHFSPSRQSSERCSFFPAFSRHQLWWCTVIVSTSDRSDDRQGGMATSHKSWCHKEADVSDVILDEVFLFLSFFLFLKNVTNTSAVSSAGVVDTCLLYTSPSPRD